MHRVQTMFAGLVASENKRAKIEITVSVFDASERRLHQTFRLKAWTNRDDQKMVTADLDDGNWNAGIYATKVVNHNLVTGETWAARGMTDALLVYAAKAALTYAQTGTVPTPGNGRIEAVEASLCGVCGAKLTDPVSIERGIGPECFGKETGTATIRSRPTKKALVEQAKAERPSVAVEAARNHRERWERDPVNGEVAPPNGKIDRTTQMKELPGNTWEDIFKAQPS